MRRVLSRLAHEEDGLALIMALAIMAVLAITTTGILEAGTANQRTSYVSDEQRQAFAIAQDGLAYAEGMLYNAAANETTPQTGVVETTPDLAVGSGTYYATVAGDGVTWTMTGTGKVGGITRTVWAQADVPGPVTSTETGVWNYVYADTSGCTNVNGNVTISVPIMVRGDMCLSGSLKFTGSQLLVGGNLTIGGSAKIGSASQKISTLRVGLTSSSTNTCIGVAPGTGACDGNHSPVYASSVAEGVDVTPQMPCIGQPSSIDPACTGSNNGTWSTLTSTYNTQAGLPMSGCPANLFDNDTTLNNSDTSISSVMFRGTAYDCTLGSSTQPCTSSVSVCEIKWTPSTHTLYVAGTLYFDGSLLISGNVTYSGQASWYFTGGVNTNGTPTFCGIDNLGNPDNCGATWDTDTSGIIMIAACWANSTGSSLITSACVDLGGGSTVQFGVYCTTQYTTAGGASNFGPVLANSLNLGGDAQTLIPFHYFPPGTPLNTATTYLPASAATNWSG